MTLKFFIMTLEFFIMTLEFFVMTLEFCFLALEFFLPALEFFLPALELFLPALEFYRFTLELFMLTQKCFFFLFKLLIFLVSHIDHILDSIAIHLQQCFRKKSHDVLRIPANLIYVPVQRLEIRIPVAKIHNLLRIFRAEKHEPCFQFALHNSILMCLFKDVKRNKNVMMYQTHSKT